MALIPVAWLAGKRSTGKPVGIEWWWLAGAFAISWLADTAAHWGNPWIVSPIYLVSQSSIVIMVFSARREAMLFVGVLVVTAVVAILGFQGPDVLLHTVAWLAIVGILYPLRQLERLRTALLVAFGFGWITWMGYVIDPGWGTWICYQLIRFAGILLFCWASMKPGPRLSLLQREG